MPNNIKNRLTLTGDIGEVNKCLTSIKGSPFEDKKEYPIDFNKIIPMPEELNITSDGWISLIENRFSAGQSLKSELDRHIERDGFKYTEDLGKSIDNLAQGIKNYLKHGSASWYGWACENWGTKWNAYCQEGENGVITFETAWSGVTKLICILSKSFPSVTFDYIYADEDTGCNVGKMTIKSGEVIKDFKPDNSSKEAYDLAFELRPDYKEDYILVDGQYQCKEEE